MPLTRESLRNSPAGMEAETGALLLQGFEAFGRRGRYITLWKTGYKGCTLIVWKPGIGETSFFHGDCLGERPGGYIQTAFVPSDGGMQKFIEELLRSHGGK
jgi:hypothetical protein